MKKNLFINKKILIIIITFCLVICGLYTTFALNVFVDDDIPKEYDLAFVFDLSSNNTGQLSIPSGKTKVFDIKVKNPYHDKIRYGIAYSLITPNSLDENVVIAQLYNSKNSSNALVESFSSAVVSIIVINQSQDDIVLSMSVLNGYKNGGELILSEGQTLINKVYPNSDFILKNYTVDGVQVKKFPSGTYDVNVNCENATLTFDYTFNGVMLSNVSSSKYPTCSLEFTTTNKTKITEYIKTTLLNGNTSIASGDGTLELINSTLDTGSVSEDYRYRGKNPNNYIIFNDELWRIIGVFDENSHGQVGKNLVKIIRNNVLGMLVWNNNTQNNTSGSNNFNDSDIYKYLNFGYYESIDATDEEYCYEVNTTKGKCNFTSKGIKKEYKRMINEAIWYLGGYNTSAIVASDMYKYERSTNTLATYYYPGNPITKTMNVGLIYASDYGYSTPSSCTSNLNVYKNEGCYDNSWIMQGVSSWSLTPYTGNSYGVFSIGYTGMMGYGEPISAYGVYPVVYLNDSVYYISGDGTPTNPYIVGM